MMALLDPSAIVATLLVPLQILLVNLLLSADNALVIAMACRGLPADHVTQATVLGVAGGVILRIVMGSMVLVLLRAPLLQVASGIALIWIAVRLTMIGGTEDLMAQPADEAASKAVEKRFAQAVGSIIVADVAMSLDNVVAVAAIAQGNLIYIVVGLGLSLPMLVWGSSLIRELLDRTGLFVLASGAFLGWVAGGIAVADPLIAPAIAAHAPALPYAVPLACAAFVVCQNLILDPRRGGRHAG